MSAAAAVRERPLRIAYLHYLDGADTALHHVRQFAAAARGLGHVVEVCAVRAAAGRGPAGGGVMGGFAAAGAGGAGGAGGPGGAGEAGQGDGRPNDAERRGLTRRASAAPRRRLLARWLHEPKELLANVWHLERELAWLRSLPRPDVLLVRDEPLAVSSVLAAARLALPLVYEMNAPAAEMALYRAEYRHLPAVAGWLEGLKLRRADAVITVSAALRRHLLARHREAATAGRGEHRVVAVPNGADLAAFRPAAAPSPLACRLLAATAAGGAYGPVIGFVGSFQAFHGIELLIEMALAVGAARPDARFLLAGDGPGAARVRQALAPLGCRVGLAGNVPYGEVPGLVAAFDVGVLPDTAFYACPLKVVEWMAAGTAVVAPGHEPLRELLDDHREGLLFPPRDGAALAAAVLRLIDCPELRRQLGAAAAARAGASLSWTDNARRVARVLAWARSGALRAGRAQPELLAQP
jgi:glycosyltransferase involved in cell wall biosynthesis